MIFINPDIHGREFWKDAIEGNENEKFVFLGDYLDPYPSEGIFPSSAWSNFMEIIDFKKAHSENVTLLLGNHDLHYLDYRLDGGRKNVEKAKEIQEFFKENISFFQMAFQTKISDKVFLMSHAGIQKGWIDEIPTERLDDLENVCENINTFFKEDLDGFLKCLEYVSRYRGGMHSKGSMVWADITEHLDDNEEMEALYYQIFGHTQHYSSEVIHSKFACLDCRRTFVLSDDGTIYPYQK